MKLKNRIISLIDLSDYSEAIIRCTQEFGSFLHAEVVFVHQLPAIVPERVNPSIKENFQSSARAQAYERITEMAGSQFEHQPAVIVSEEDLPTVVHRIINDHFFNWLFIGLKGTSFLEQMFMGTKAVHIINETDFVTVAFPLTTRAFSPGEIIVAVQEKAVADSKQLKKVILQLSESVPKITILSIVAGSENESEIQELKHQLIGNFDEYNPTSVVFKGPDVYNDLENFLKQKNNSLLVLQEEDTRLSRFKKNIVSELIYKSLIPLIILPRTMR